MRSIQLILTVVALSGCSGSKPETVETPPPPPAPEKYTVKIHRPFTAGQVLTVDVEAHQSSTAAVHDGDAQQVIGVADQIDLHLVGDVTIDEVAPDGRAAAATLKVTSFTNPKSQEAILPADSVIHAKRVDGMLVPELEGGKLNDHQTRLLQLAFPLERPGTHVGDELFGTPDPKAVGDSWPFNRAYVVEDLRDEGFGTAETGIDGTVKLTEVVPCGKVQCLKLQIDMKADHAAQLAVEGASDVGTGELNSTIVMEVPVDTTNPVHLEDAKTTLNFEATFTATGDGDQKGSKRMVAVSRDRHATYVPKE